MAESAAGECASQEILDPQENIIGSPAYLDHLYDPHLQGGLSEQDPLSLPVHPTQLYEAGALLLLFWLLHRLFYRMKWPPGTIFFVLRCRLCSAFAPESSSSGATLGGGPWKARFRRRRESPCWHWWVLQLHCPSFDVWTNGRTMRASEDRPKSLLSRWSHSEDAASLMPEVFGEGGLLVREDAGFRAPRRAGGNGRGGG